MSAHTRAKATLAVAILLTLALPCAAQTPEPGVHLTVLGSAEVALTGESDAQVRPAADVTVDGPLALGGASVARVQVRLRVFGLPGETVDLTDVATFRAAEVSLGAYRRVGRLSISGQEVWTSIAGEWGFATVRGTDPAPLLRYPRHYGIGVRLEERGGSWLSLLYGRDESAGERGWGQWRVAGAVPLAMAKGAVVLGGDATLSVGPEHGLGQRDLLRLWVAVSLPDLVEVVR